MADGGQTPPPPVEMVSGDSIQLQDTLVKLSEAIVKLGTATQDFSATQESYTMLQQQAAVNRLQPDQANAFMQQAVSQSDPMANAEVIGAMKEMNANLAALKDLQQQSAQQQIYASGKRSPDDYSREDNSNQISMLISQMQQFVTMAHTTSAQTYMGNDATQQINNLALQSAYSQARPQEFSDSDMQEMAAQSRSMYANTQRAATNFVVSNSLGVRGGGTDGAEFSEVLPMMNEFAAKSGQTVTQVGELMRKLKDVGQISADVSSGSFEQIYMGLRQLEGVFTQASGITQYAPPQTLEQRAGAIAHSSDINAALYSAMSGASGGYDPVLRMVGGNRGMEQRMSAYGSQMMQDTLGYMNTLGSGDYEKGLDLYESDFTSDKEFSDQYIESQVRLSEASASSQSASRKALEIQNRILMFKNEFGMTQSEAEMAAFKGDAKAVLSYRRLHKDSMKSAGVFAEDLVMAENQTNFIRGKDQEETDIEKEMKTHIDDLLKDNPYATGFNMAVDMAILDPANDLLSSIRNSALELYKSKSTGQNFGVEAGKSSAIDYDNYNFATAGLQSDDGLSYNIKHTNEASDEYMSATLGTNINMMSDISASLDTEDGVNYILREYNRLGVHGKISEQDVKNAMKKAYMMYTVKDTVFSPSSFSEADIARVLKFIDDTPIQTFAHQLSMMLPDSNPILALLSKVVGVSVLPTSGGMTSEQKLDVFGKKLLQNAYAPGASGTEDLLNKTGTGTSLTESVMDWTKSTTAGAMAAATADSLDTAGLVATGVGIVATVAGATAALNAIPVVGTALWGIGVASTALAVATLGAVGVEKIWDYEKTHLGDVIDHEAISEFAARNIPQVAKEKILIAQTLSTAFDFVVSDNQVAVTNIVRALFMQYRAAHAKVVGEVQNDSRAGEKDDEDHNDIKLPGTTLNQIALSVSNSPAASRLVTSKSKLLHAVKTVLYMVNDKSSAVGKMLRTGRDMTIKDFIEDLTNYLAQHQPHTIRADEEDVNTAQQVMKSMENGNLDETKVAEMFLAEATYNKSDTITKHIENIETAIRAVSLGSDDVDATVKEGTKGVNEILQYLRNPEGDLDLSDEEIDIIAKIPGVDASQIKNYVANIKKAKTVDEKRSTASTLLQYIDSKSAPVVETANMKASLMTSMIVQILGNLRNMKESDDDVKWILNELG